MSKFERWMLLIKVITESTGKTSLPIYYINSKGFVRIFVTKL